MTARRPNPRRPLLVATVRIVCLIVHSLFVVAASATLVFALFLWLLLQLRKGLA